jgi:hypothetical protein
MSTVDLGIVVFYFALVLGIGFYLKRFAKLAKTSSWPAAK